MLRQNISQKQTQKILPKIVLNQNILAIPTLALDNLIKRELEMNPMLEEGVEPDIDVNTDTESAANADTDTAQEKLSEENTDSEITSEEIPEPESKTEDEYNWDEYFENESESQTNYRSGSDTEFDTNNIKDDEQSMYDNLIVQLHMCDIPQKEIFTGEEIIWSLDNDGYFREEIGTVLEDINHKKAGMEFENEEFSEEDLINSLEYIQNNLDPPGIAARNLAECLILQVKRSSIDVRIKELTVRTLETYFEDLKHKRFEKLAAELGIKLDEVKEIFDIIHKLSPKPYSQDNDDFNSYIVPDLIVKKINGKYEVYMNEKYIPTLTINKTYSEMYKNRKNTLDKNTKEYLLNNFNKAKWFIDAINSRRETMIKITEAIIKRQTEFFDNNGENLKPVFEKDIAEDIKMDTSTISRAVKGKYLQTDFGIYELRSFFSNSVSKDDGSEVSTIEVRNKIRDIIEKENKENPLTDLQISAELSKSGINIARRTVAKYRESIDIPISKQRREIINK
ncbi:MAG TPA: RNA polymerase factor sigma-54 [Ignavibacteria bacterium]|mgnify:CR=1 FL=1|nr:RNA polymerase sigma-54 factor [Bacteroidota bacterium]HRI84002.1 RNA polymerase factor sigma-54 [Ignavibacteria bacterium]HRJ99199.1 RNA polymerase factor sigma-54 [Ignavibacteria bacterium]